MNIYIYGLKCLKTNKMYIGSTGNLKNRASTHFSLLNSGKHYATELQKDFTLFGINSFDLVILGVCKLKDALECEGTFIKKHAPFVYNIQFKAHERKSRKCVVLNDLSADEIVFKKRRSPTNNRRA